MTASVTADDHFRGTDRFELRRRIGAGGFGFVYEAWDRERNERVAIKTLRTPTPSTILLLKNEFRVVHDIDHPNLVRLGELFEHRGDWFFTMEFIDGVSFTRYVRPDDPYAGTSAFDGPPPEKPAPVAFDEARLRSVLGQLVRGLSVLHAANKVHRDVKPANVIVEGAGRLVLLDFGVVTDLGRQGAFVDTGLTGTAHFMAPEQAASEDVGPASDWYAVGVMLFRALTGRLPFVGSPSRVLEDKLLREAPPPRTMASGIPEDLELLCMDLLKASPSERPTGPEILERLDGPAARAEITLAMAARTFVGRVQEQEILASAVRSVRTGHAATVIVHGESGVGKSFLVRQFASTLSESDANVSWFRGRCYEQESVPFKAFDGVVDQLSEYIGNMPDEDREHLIPTNVGLLVGTFPVLSKLARDAATDVDIVNPRERRARVFAALRELLSRLSRVTLVAIVIDDLQWADADSVSLLAEVFEPSQAPPVLLIGTTRLPPLELAAQFGPVLGKGGHLRNILLGRLPDAEAWDLASTLLGGRSALGSPDEIIGTIVKESDGHPLFIGDLVEQHLLAPESTTLRLEDALKSRIQAQSDVAKRLLEVVAIAGIALSDDVLHSVAKIDPSEFHTLVARLRGLHLIRSSGSGRDHVIGLFHERVREAILSHGKKAARPVIHLRLAEALVARGGVDDEVLAGHFRAGGETVQANDLLRKAAEGALSSLAFDRAARLFGEAGGYEAAGPLRKELRRKQADALRNAGKLGDSAEILVELAMDSDALAALDLKRTAAEQFVCSGRYERGVALLREAVAGVHERFPESAFAIIFWLLVTRARLALRGLGYVVKPRPTELTLEHARIDTLWSAGSSFSMTDNARGAYFLTRNFIRSLDAGDMATIPLATIMETCFVSSEGKKKEARVAELMERSETLAKQEPRPITSAGIWIARGWTKYMVGEWAAARTGFLEAERQLRDLVVGYRFQLATVRTVLYRALVNMGRFEEMRRLIPPVYREAAHQNDQFIIANIRSNPLAWVGLADDAPDRVDVELDEAEKTLTSSRFLLQHFYVHTARCNVELYRGDAEAAYVRMAGMWRTIKRSLLLRIQPVRNPAYEQKARLALALSHVVSARDPSRQKSLLEEAQANSALLRAQGLACSDGHAELIEGLISLTRGESVAAKMSLERAITLFDSLDMAHYAAAARDRLGHLLAGVAGAELRAKATEWAETEKVVSPDKLFRLIAPVPKSFV